MFALYTFFEPAPCTKTTGSAAMHSKCLCVDPFLLPAHSNWQVKDERIALQILLDIDVNHVVAVAELAGQAIMDVYESEAESWNVNHKADDSPLTRADTEANRIICEALLERTPHIPIISEENKLDAYERRKVRVVSKVSLINVY